MKVLIPSPLRSYTKTRAASTPRARPSASCSRISTASIPGIRFRMIDEQDRMRPHIRFFVNGEQTFDPGLALRPTDEVCIVQALSGG